MAKSNYAVYIPKGEEAEIGDIIALDINNEEESYVKATADLPVVGVFSMSFEIITGGDGRPNNDQSGNYLAVAFTGIVETKVKGKAKKGQFIVPSDEAGIGTASDSKENAIGMLVEDDEITSLRLLRVKLF